MLFHHLDEPRKDNLRPFRGLLGELLLRLVDDVAQIIEHGQQERTYQRPAEVLGRIGDATFDTIEITAENLGIGFTKLHHREGTGIEEDSRKVADIVDYLTEEADGHHHGQPLYVIRSIVVVHYMVLRDDKYVTGRDLYLTGIKGVLQGATGT